MAHLHFTIILKNRGIYWTHVFSILITTSATFSIDLRYRVNNFGTQIFMAEAINSISWGIKIKICISDQITIINCIIDFHRRKLMLQKMENAIFIIFCSCIKQIKLFLRISDYTNFQNQFLNTFCKWSVKSFD